MFLCPEGPPEPGQQECSYLDWRKKLTRHNTEPARKWRRLQPQMKGSKTHKPPTTVEPKHTATEKRKTRLTTPKNSNSHVLLSLRTRGNLHHLQKNQNPQHLHHATSGGAVKQDPSTYL
ncbi:hypothetical protein HID58_059141 [Brassica napus]|uniref:(rape) hypothetical protein n=1 Tax=Brassica napus TaxID=3708 RepID=A0A816JCE3_BRANA|nr:hypothetical protein HID58_059141 [Brassica napus]CAF1818235.1 unnamed protein product [Brassica napus]